MTSLRVPDRGPLPRLVVLLLLQQCDARHAILAGPLREACFSSFDPLFALLYKTCLILLISYKSKETK